MIPYLLIIFYIGITMYTANQVYIGVWQIAGLRILLYIAVALIFMLAMFPLQLTVLETGGVSDLPPVSYETALAVMGFALFTGSISVGIVNFNAPRLWLERIAPNFRPDSVVHITAVVLMCLTLTGIMVLFILSGGLAGMAESIQITGINPLETLVTTLLEVIAAVLGVGYAIRRNGAQTLERLGLQLPTRQQLLKGIGAGTGLYFVAAIFALIWTSIVSPEQLQQQTQASEQLALAINTLPIALIVALSAAVGEEIFIRGALQPVFGVLLSSIFFTLLHTQYLITPTMLLIFLISLGFGLLRQRVNTTTAIIAHFVYNFLPFMLIALLGSEL